LTSLANGKPAGWCHFEHGADVGVRGWGPSPEVAFEQAALAMTAVVTDLDRVLPVTTVQLRCTAPVLDLMLVAWLNGLVFEMATRGMLFSSFSVRIEGHRLSARAGGERVERERHELAAEVKGATYTALAVKQCTTGRWLAQCVVDV
jgi:tRNA nucleotidyltransferase (CCA-adding enzyme)